jgi:hypothetical protein
MSTLTLYHGSNAAFDSVDLEKSKDRRDFGRGFYLTSLKQQAIDWALTMKRRFASESCYVYTFEFKVDSSLKIKPFTGLTVEWLEFVKLNRTLGGTQHSFDVVSGPVANDDTFRTIALYIEGDYTAEQAIEKLRHAHPNNQVSLHTVETLRFLRLIGREILG